MQNINTQDSFCQKVDRLVLDAHMVFEKHKKEDRAQTLKWGKAVDERSYRMLCPFPKSSARRVTPMQQLIDSMVPGMQCLLNQSSNRFAVMVAIIM